MSNVKKLDYEVYQWNYLKDTCVTAYTMREDL